MPPRRTARSSASPRKRYTQLEDPEPSASIKARAQPSIHLSIASTPQKNIRTYGRRNAVERREAKIEMQEEAEKKQDPDSEGDYIVGESEDELDTLSPTKQRDTIKPQRDEVPQEDVSRSDSLPKRSAHFQKSLGASSPRLPPPTGRNPQKRPVVEIQSRLRAKSNSEVIPKATPRTSRKRKAVDTPVQKKNQSSIKLLLLDSDDEMSVDSTPSKRPPKRQKLVVSRPVIQLLTQDAVPETPRKNKDVETAELSTTTPQSSPRRRRPLSRSLPSNLLQCFSAQKLAIVRSLFRPAPIILSDDDDDSAVSVNETALEQLRALLNGTVERKEGNSCIVIGPRGSGKTTISDTCISELKSSDPLKGPIVIRLCGWLQINDRLAMREIARQLETQTGTAFLTEELGKVTNFEDLADGTTEDADDDVVYRLSAATDLPILISRLATFSRPTIIIMDGFDLFALHARQALLYCLFDSVQACTTDGSGLAVIGLTSRIDTINILEKRVKSRFSGRIIRTASPKTVDDFAHILQKMLCCPPEFQDEDSFPTAEDQEEWYDSWTESVDKFIKDRETIRILEDTFSVGRDVRTLLRMMVASVIKLNPEDAFLTANHLASAAVSQRARPDYPYLSDLSYPSLCLLIASMHAGTAGYPFVTFEMLQESVRIQIRTSCAAPVQINGGSIGMMKCTREVLSAAFDNLISANIFVAIAASSSTVDREYVKYRVAPSRKDIRLAVDKSGQINLKKWLGKGTATK